jgi:hypothetical protein
MMHAAAVRRGAFLVLAALVQLAVWLLIRPDLAGPQWAEGNAFEVWLAVEAVVAAAIGLLAPDRSAVLGAGFVGWGLQAVHLIVLGDHYDDDGLWGLAVIMDVVLAGLAVCVALAVRTLTGRDRRRSAG